MKLLFAFVVLAIFANLASAQTVVYNPSASASLSVRIANKNGPDAQIFLSASASALYSNSLFNASWPTVFYSPGWICNATTDTFVAIRNAYLAKGQVNFVYADWFTYNRGFYWQAAANSRLVADSFAQWFVNGWTNSSITNKNCSDWTFIGHSMGAQLMGFIGRRVQFYTNATLILPNIVGLDPAGPSYHTLCNTTISQPLNKTDAKFVDVLHTDTVFLGTSAIIGHRDVFANGGCWQRGCPVLSTIIGLIFNLNATAVQDAIECSHNRAAFLWAETVLNTTAMPIVAGPNYCIPIKLFGFVIPPLCPTWTNGAYFGFAANASFTGSFVFRTNSNSSYGLGLSGTVFTSLAIPFVY